jgi:hypothetical protein
MYLVLFYLAMAVAVIRGLICLLMQCRLAECIDEPIPADYSTNNPHFDHTEVGLIWNLA